MPPPLAIAVRRVVFAQVFFDQKVQIQQTASAQETLSTISALGPALDQPGSGLPSAPIVDLGWVADLLKLDSGKMAEMAEQVGAAAAAAAPAPAAPAACP